MGQCLVLTITLCSFNRMMGILTFGMVTILLLTLVSFKAAPLRIWSSNTISPNSTWKGNDTKLSQGIWKPAYHIATFLGKRGAMIFELQQDEQAKFTKIDSSLNGRILNSTTIPKTYFLLRNNGELLITADGRRTPVYRSRNVYSAPIEWWSRESVRRCLTTSASNLTTFDLCKRFYSTWMHRENGQVVNVGSNSCLDVGTGNSARNNTCDSTKSTQKWKWVNGYLQVTISNVTSCLKAIPRTIDLNPNPNPNSFNSVIGLCDGPRMAWNKLLN